MIFKIVIILHTLNFYIETISNILGENLENHMMKESIDIYSSKLKDLWSDTQINIIYLTFQEINMLNDNKGDNFEINSLTESIESILSYKENKVKSIVSRISTTL